MAGKRDWAGYNAALERRGSLTLFVDDDTLAGWLNVERPGRPGAPFTYSDAAYRACYQLQIVYGLPLRQTRGLVTSLLSLLGARLRVPSVASLSEQRARVNAEPLAAPARGRRERGAHAPPRLDRVQDRWRGRVAWSQVAGPGKGRATEMAEAPRWR
jgi:hypothetical protein